jgi:hypothetical protein
LTLFPFVAHAAEQGSPEAPWFKALATPQLVLVVLLLIVLGVLFYLVFRWSQRNEQAGYLGRIFREAVFDFELSRRGRRVDEKRDREEYLREAEADHRVRNISIPEYPEPDQQLRPYLSQTGIAATGHSDWTPSGYGNTLPGYRGDRGDPLALNEGYFLAIEAKLPDALKPHLAEYKRKFADYWRKIDERTQKRQEVANEAYQKEYTKAVKEAEDAADRAADVDIAVFRGRGPTFVLEFTAVVVIIFAAMILGIWDKLMSDQLGTLLAAIAGYVLGRATAVSSQGEPRARTEGQPEKNPS